MSSTLHVTISGNPVTIREASLKISDRVDDKKKCTFTVLDATGALIFQHGQKVSITDDTLGTLFTGFVDKPTATNLFPSPDQEWSIDCVNKFYVPAKKTSKRKHKKQHSGVIVAQQIQQYLEPDGVSGNFGLDFLEMVPDWQTGTHSGTVAATNTSTGNVGAGDLELITAGDQVQFQQSSQADFNSGTTGQGLTSPATGGVTLTPTPAIKLQATVGASGLTNGFTYVKIWDKILGTYVIPSSSPYLFYDVWTADSCPQQMAGIEILCTDGTSYAATQTQWSPDQQGILGGPNNDLSGIATNQWYSRFLPLYLSSSMAGKTIQSISVAFGGSSQGTYTAYFRNISIANYDGSSALVVLNSASTVIPVVPQQLANNGYSKMSCTLVSSYEKHGAMYSPFFSLSAATMVQSSYLHWVATVPANCALTITASVDAFSTFLPCVNNMAIPGVLPGMNLAGKTLIFVYTMDNNGNDPTITPFLSSVAGNVTPAFPCNKTDVISTTNGTTGWNGGTLTNLINNSNNALQLNGYGVDWSDGIVGAQTLYGTASPVQSVVRKQFTLTTGTGADARARLDFAGSAWQNFIAEVDIAVPTATNNAGTGIVYRCTGWQNNNDSYAYSVQVSGTQITFGHGTNSASGAGSFTSIATAAVTFTAGTIYHLKVVVNGSSHKIYVNDVLYINVTDATYSAAGYLGLRLYNASGSTQTAAFGNFGVVAALSGTWVSPAIDIHTAGVISDSQIILQIDPSLIYSLLTFLVEISLNNGSTWTTCPNLVATSSGYYQVLPVPGLLSGTDVSSITQARLRLTITATTASLGLNGTANIAADLTAVSLFVIGPYNSSGSRTNAPLAWDSMDRLNVVSGFGHASDLQVYTQTGTGATAVTSGEATISNTTGDVHMQPGTRTGTDLDGTVCFQISASSISAGIELRYNSATSYYRLAASTTLLSITKNTGGGALTLASTTLTLLTGTWYHLRFRVTGSGPVVLQGRVWLDGTTEPAGWNISVDD